MKNFARLIITLIITACAVLVSEAQTSTSAILIEFKERASVAVVLLDRSPILSPKPANAFTDDEFIALARVTIEGISPSVVKGIVFDSDKIKTVEDALKSLEGVIYIALNSTSGAGWKTSTPPVNKPIASIISKPQNLSVKYRRTVDHLRNLGVFLNTKTNSAKEVDPAFYTFILTRANGVQEEQTINCTKNCVVDFK